MKEKEGRVENGSLIWKGFGESMIYDVKKHKTDRDTNTKVLTRRDGSCVSSDRS